MGLNNRILWSLGSLSVATSVAQRGFIAHAKNIGDKEKSLNNA